MSIESYPSWDQIDFRGSESGSIESLLSSGENPWMTLGIMDSIEDEALLKEWENVLSVQTRLLAAREVEWMKSRGLGRNGRPILEIGSANGSYGQFLANSFPHLTLFGVEANPNLSAMLDLKACPENYSIAHCKVGDEPLPQHIQNNFDDCVLRFVAQHVSDPLRLLRAAYEGLPEGGSIFVIEEDDAFFGSYPENTGFETAFDIWRRVIAVGGSNSKIGRDLPRLAAEAGFYVASYEITLRNNVEAGSHFNELFIGTTRMFHRTNPALVSIEEVELVTRHLSSSEKTEGSVATYPQVLLHAVKR
ncbi:class I SAM-dependent methyltransferase [Streptomyces sp. NPDC053431]|uniref:class I SAM-dependent methyltransferase n=1 Tax=Streptomyces sp. NPDC053431 TaxID=3365703 RepID=UPI0037D7A637